MYSEMDIGAYRAGYLDIPLIVIVGVLGSMQYLPIGAIRNPQNFRAYMAYPNNLETVYCNADQISRS